MTTYKVKRLETHVRTLVINADNPVEAIGKALNWDERRSKRLALADCLGFEFVEVNTDVGECLDYLPAPLADALADSPFVDHNHQTVPGIESIEEYYPHETD